MITEPLQFVHDVKAAVHDEGVHPPCFGAESGDTIAALLGGAEFELKQRIIFGAYDAKIIRHDEGCGTTCGMINSEIFYVGIASWSRINKYMTEFTLDQIVLSTICF